MTLDNQAPLFLPCAQGVEPLLAAECRELLAEGASGGAVSASAPLSVQERRGGVCVMAGPLAAMRLNLHSRLAQRDTGRARRGRRRRAGATARAGPGGCEGSAAWPPGAPPSRTRHR
ncbi:MAG: hypothetical protein ACKOB5_11280, partial [Betaproteobacteria bacterium]